MGEAGGGGRVKLGRRVGRLERPRPGGRLPAWARALTERVAGEHGLDPGEVAREAEALLARAGRAGVLGDAEDLARFLAAGRGGDPAELLAEAGRIAAWLLPQPGCGACKGWTGVVLVGDDGPHRLGRCTGCRRVVATRATVRVVGVRIVDI